jgi:large subunit ribosomal protein L5
MISKNNSSRLQKLFTDKAFANLQKDLELSNPMEVPRLAKIVINIGVGSAVTDSRAIQRVLDVVEKIAGQKPVKTVAKKSIAGFKLREDMPIGVRVTLRKRAMWEFLDRLITLALPQVRDFQGVPTKFDGRGNYNLGIKEWIIFPEVDYESYDKAQGMNITVHTTARNDQQGFALLKELGMPFKRK